MAAPLLPQISFVVQGRPLSELDIPSSWVTIVDFLGRRRPLEGLTLSEGETTMQALARMAVEQQVTVIVEPHEN